ncbi:hypothetical protein J7T55_003727 [Diaporthe amygdali]|uniref:uncharacterized protein n=1 Tax=Phomopsis amygdali TaxID=1214568 RepID=UPI0022FE68E9|nr:uncharacterized protein J7T55_003727 [Diaporthe amygdali]KAJ0117314.1 hypothetical protein J7T55_003727 [Diaporthe amygdali]
MTEAAQLMLTADTTCLKVCERAYQLVSRQAPLECHDYYNGTVAYQIRGDFDCGGGPGDRYYQIVSGQG